MCVYISLAAERGQTIKNTQKEHGISKIFRTNAASFSGGWTEVSRKLSYVLSKFEILYGICRHCVFQANEERASVLVWWCFIAHGKGNFHISEGTISIKQVQVLEQHVLP